MVSCEGPATAILSDLSGQEATTTRHTQYWVHWYKGTCNCFTFVVAFKDMINQVLQSNSSLADLIQPFHQKGILSKFCREGSECNKEVSKCDNLNWQVCSRQSQSTAIASTAGAVQVNCGILTVYVSVPQYLMTCCYKLSVIG